MWHFKTQKSLWSFWKAPLLLSNYFLSLFLWCGIWKLEIPLIFWTKHHSTLPFWPFWKETCTADTSVAKWQSIHLWGPWPPSSKHTAPTSTSPNFSHAHTHLSPYPSPSHGQDKDWLRYTHALMPGLCGANTDPLPWEYVGKKSTQRN